jgi:hypothetical protein
MGVNETGQRVRRVDGQLTFPGWDMVGFLPVRHGGAWLFHLPFSRGDYVVSQNYLLISPNK